MYVHNHVRRHSFAHAHMCTYAYAQKHACKYETFTPTCCICRYAWIQTCKRKTLRLTLAPPAPILTPPIPSIGELSPPFLHWGRAPEHLLDLHLFRGVILLFHV
jgi:hypothetical protein